MIYNNDSVRYSSNNKAPTAEVRGSALAVQIPE